jgi:hypothetical protein
MIRWFLLLLKKWLQLTMIKDAESFARSNFAFKYQDSHVQGEK